MKAYKIEFHSFIDVITNSSTEMFMSSDQTIVKFFEELLGKKGIGDERGSYIKVMTFKEFCEVSWLGDICVKNYEKLRLK